MTYANLLTLPSAFPVSHPEEARRAWVARSFVCLGLCLVFITTVAFTPIGYLRSQPLNAARGYLNQRQVTDTLATESQDGQIAARGIPESSVPKWATVFLTPGWNDPSQAVSAASSWPAADSSAIETASKGVLLPTEMIQFTHESVSFVVDGGGQPKTAMPPQTTARPSGPSLNPSIGAMGNGNGEAAGRAGSSVLQAPQASNAEHIAPVAPSSNPSIFPFNIPSAPNVGGGESSVGKADQQRPSDTKVQQSEDDYSSDDRLSIAVSVPVASPSAGSQVLPHQVGTPFWEGPLPGSWDTASSQRLQPLIPLPDPSGSPPPTEAEQPSSVTASAVQCPPCPLCNTCIDLDKGEAHGENLNGPCSGQGFRCDECLNGWFCPPKETPAQVLPCGLGWPCFHCSSSTFCIPGTGPGAPPGQGNGPAAPEPAPAPFPSPAESVTSLPSTRSLTGPSLNSGSSSATSRTPTSGDSSEPSGYEGKVPPGQEVPAAQSEDTLFPVPTQTGLPLPSAVGSYEGGPQSGHLSESQANYQSPLWKYLGCFRDDVTRALAGAHPLDYLRGDMSPLTCVAHCGTRGFSLAGVENGEECWCGRSIRDDMMRLPESCCEMPCRGNAGATCGGDWAIGVFQQAASNVEVQSPAYDMSPT